MDWKVVAAFASVFVAVIVACTGIWQYGDKKKQSNREPFNKAQMEYCLRACDAVGHMISENNPRKWQVARVEFWALYWGPLAVVEDRNVEAAMAQMRELVPAPELPIPQTVPINDQEFRRRSLQLSHTVRNLILRSWDVQELGKLANDYSIRLPESHG